MINDETLAKFPRLQRLLERVWLTRRRKRAGSRVEFYERQDGELAVSCRVEPRRKLGLSPEAAARGRGALPARSSPSQAEFDAFFPAITNPPLTSATAREQEDRRATGALWITGRTHELSSRGTRGLFPDAYVRDTIEMPRMLGMTR